MWSNAMHNHKQDILEMACYNVSVYCLLRIPPVALYSERRRAFVSAVALTPVVRLSGGAHTRAYRPLT